MGSSHTILDEAFGWSTTKEGLGFWRNIRNVPFMQATLEQMEIIMNNTKAKTKFTMPTLKESAKKYLTCAHTKGSTFLNLEN